MPHHTRIVLDIETIPDQSEGAAERAASRITAPSNYKDPAKIEAYIQEKAADAWRRTALDGGYGEVVVIGFALDDEDATAIYRDPDSGPEGERRLLENFWSMIEEELVFSPKWIGHRILSFDLRFLWRRSVILRVPMGRPLPFGAAPWSKEVADTSYMWTGDRNGGIALVDLARILSIDGAKDGIDGSMVWDAIEDGRMQDVVDYCIKDVEITREAYYRMLLWGERESGEEDLPL